jgi:hypothetical protein
VPAMRHADLEIGFLIRSLKRSFSTGVPALLLQPRALAGEAENFFRRLIIMLDSPRRCSYYVRYHSKGDLRSKNGSLITSLQPFVSH